MADAEDLKSSGDFSSCGFDSHPGHHFLHFIFDELECFLLGAASLQGSRRLHDDVWNIPLAQHGVESGHVRRQELLHLLL